MPRRDRQRPGQRPTRERQSRIGRVASGPELSFGTRLKDARRDAGLSIRGLSKRADVGETTIQKYEAGQSLPGISELRKFSQALQVSLQHLVYGSESYDSVPRGSFFGRSFDDDMYVPRLGAAMLALPESDRLAVQQLLESLLRAKLGAERLARLETVAWQWLSRLTVDAAAGDRLDIQPLPPELARQLGLDVQAAGGPDRDPDRAAGSQESSEPAAGAGKPEDSTD